MTEQSEREAKIAIMQTIFERLREHLKEEATDAFIMVDRRRLLVSDKCAIFLHDFIADHLIGEIKIP